MPFLNTNIMPIDPVTGALITTGANVLNNAISGFGARRQNHRNVENWKMQNEYNSPKAQMQRFQEAGLNPRLIYGQSAGGAAGNAGSVSAAQRPETTPFNPIQTYQDIRQSNAQQDLTVLQGNTEFQKAILTAEQQAHTGAKFRQTVQDTAQSKELFSSQLQAANLNVKNMEQDILGKQLQNDFKSQAMQDQLKNIYYQAKATESNSELLRLQTQFLNLGLDRNSPWYAKIFGNIINKVNK